MESVRRPGRIKSLARAAAVSAGISMALATAGCSSNTTAKQGAVQSEVTKEIESRPEYRMDKGPLNLAIRDISSNPARSALVFFEEGLKWSPVANMTNTMSTYVLSQSFSNTLDKAAAETLRLLPEGKRKEVERSEGYISTFYKQAQKEGSHSLNLGTIQFTANSQVSFFGTGELAFTLPQTYSINSIQVIDDMAQNPAPAYLLVKSLGIASADGARGLDKPSVFAKYASMTKTILEVSDTKQQISAVNSTVKIMGKVNADLKPLAIYETANLPYGWPYGYAYGKVEAPIILLSKDKPDAYFYSKGSVGEACADNLDIAKRDKNACIKTAEAVRLLRPSLEQRVFDSRQALEDIGEGVGLVGIVVYAAGRVFKPKKAK